MDTTKIQPVDWAIGAALFMRRDFYAFLGGFDQNYFLYMEDEDIVFDLGNVIVLSFIFLNYNDS